MFGDLTQPQMQEVLAQQLIGRIGCSAKGITYVVPISYVYHGNTIYCHTHEGMKLRLMRENPQVCFEVDCFENMEIWKSVIGWGEFVEVTEGAERHHALQLLMNRKLPFISSKTMQLGQDWPFNTADPNAIDGILFKIALQHTTGKYERLESIVIA